MAPKNVPAEEIISIFEKYNLNTSMASYYKIDEMAERYEFYSTSCHCDCNSIISRLQNENVSSFDAYKIKKKNEDTEKLNRMKEVKANKDYEKRVKEFENERDRLWELLDSFSKNIIDYETEETEKILALNLQDEEQSKMFNEILYPKLNEMHKELDSNKEYQNTLKEFRDFLAENTDLDNSIYYNIADFEKTINEYDFSDFIDQFNSLKNTFREILELADEICIYPFWQDREPSEIKNKRQVVLQNLNIDDWVFLSYRNLLKIVSVREWY